MNSARTALSLLLLSLCACISSLQPAAALIIDSFDGSQVPPPVLESTTEEFSGAVSSASIGNARKLLVKKTSGLSGDAVRAYVSNGLLSHSQDSLTSGSTTVTWDTSTSATLIPNGLPQVNFYSDNGQNIEFSIHSFDYANSQPLVLIVTVYDALDASGGSWSSVMKEVNYQVSAPNPNVVDDPNKPRTLLIPFSDFLNAPFEKGPTGIANFSNVGAVTLTILGSEDQDLRLTWIGTDGGCRETLPNEFGQVKDQCNVCGGNGLSCLDCEGIPFGPAKPNTACSTFQPGICSDGVYNANCQCEPSNQPGPELCDGIDNNCNGETDEAFPDLGKDCSVGKPGCVFNGTYQCTQDGQLRCTADDHQDEAETCDGTRGCDGVPFSGLIADACGICGGNGTTCLDCAGVAHGNATFDRCGVCNGDGLSCLGCETRQLKTILANMDNGAKLQEQLLTDVYERIKVGTKDKGILRQVRSAELTAHKLQLRNWILSWTFPVTVNSCTNTTFCSSASFSPLAQEYAAHSIALRDLMQGALQLLARVRKVLPKEKAKQLKRAQVQHDTNMQYLAQVPSGASSCS